MHQSALIQRLLTTLLAGSAIALTACAYSTDPEVAYLRQQQQDNSREQASRAAQQAADEAARESTEGARD